MPSGPRIRSNNQFGATSDNPLTAGAVTFNSSRLGDFPAVSSAHAVVTLDPLRLFGDAEIVVITAHTALATSATITRGAYGTVAREHPQGTTWIHAPIDEDVTEILTSGTLPSDPYAGQTVFETDTGFQQMRNPANDTWYPGPNVPACRIHDNAVQSISHNVVTTIDFNSERFDTDSMHDNVTNNSRITINTAGLYVVTAVIALEANSDYTELVVILNVNGATQIAAQRAWPNTQSLNPHNTVSTIWLFSAGDYIETTIRQRNGAAAARNTTVSVAQTPEFAATWLGTGE